MLFKKKEKSEENKTLKTILFFGFYLIFFILLFTYLKNNQNNNHNQDTEETKTSIVTIQDLYSKNFTYYFEIEDDETIRIFKGTKDKIDYEDFDNKYFLNYVNINQLMKKGKVTSAGQIMTYYEISNDSLNELLGSVVPSGINEIKEYYGTVQNNNEYFIVLNLDSYMGRSYKIKLKYMVGDNHE